ARKEVRILDGHPDLPAQALLGADWHVGVRAEAEGILIPPSDEMAHRLRDALPIHLAEAGHQACDQLDIAPELVLLAGRSRAEGEQNREAGDPVEVDELGPDLVQAPHVSAQLVFPVPENRVELEEDLVEDTHAGLADRLSLALRQARVEGDPSRLPDSQGSGDEQAGGLE